MPQFSKTPLKIDSISDNPAQNPYGNFACQLGMGGIVGEWELPEDYSLERQLVIEKPKDREKCSIIAGFVRDLRDFKKNRSLSIRALLGDRDDLKAELEEWIKKVAIEAKPLLREAFVDYEVSPSLILEILISVKARQLIHDEKDDILRSLNSRKKDAETINQALNIAWEYAAEYPKKLSQTSQAISVLRGLAERIPSLNPRVTGRRASRVYLKLAAYELSSALKTVPMGRKKYDYELVGGLLQIVFGYAFPSLEDLSKIIGEGKKIAEGLAVKYPTSDRRAEFEHARTCQILARK